MRTLGRRVLPLLVAVLLAALCGCQAFVKPLPGPLVAAPSQSGTPDLSSPNSAPDATPSSEVPVPPDTSASLPDSSAPPSAPSEINPAPVEETEEPEPFVPPDECILPVENILQQPELPNGCEGTSLTIVLNYLGYPADKLDICYNYIPTEPFDYSTGARTAPHPESAYPGNPGGHGFYCFTRPVAEAANAYLGEQNAPYRAHQINGSTEEQLVAELAKGNPLIVWKTLYNNAPYTNASLGWHISGTSIYYAPYVNLHVVVLSGYDAENFYFADPLGLYAAIPRATFMEVYTQMGMRAVVIRSEALEEDAPAQSEDPPLDEMWQFPYVPPAEETPGEEAPSEEAPDENPDPAEEEVPTDSS